jgi:hypothetical protein
MERVGQQHQLGDATRQHTQLPAREAGARGNRQHLRSHLVSLSQFTSPFDGIHAGIRIWVEFHNDSEELVEVALAFVDLCAGGTRGGLVDNRRDPGRRCTKKVEHALHLLGVIHVLCGHSHVVRIFPISRLSCSTDCRGRVNLDGVVDLDEVFEPTSRRCAAAVRHIAVHFDDGCC